MKKLYEKNEVGFALVWIGLYVVVMNVALQVCGGFDHLEEKTASQLLVPVVCIVVLALAATLWIVGNGLSEQYGLCRFRGSRRVFLWFLPLAVMSCTNLKDGVMLSAPVSLSVLMAVNLAVGGYVEELIFRGFLFRAMAKENLPSAVAVSAITFGLGHIVNLLNTADTLGVLLQVPYAIAIGFLYTVIVYKGGSLWPCITSHMFVNASSVFPGTGGPFTACLRPYSGRYPRSWRSSAAPGGSSCCPAATHGGFGKKHNIEMAAPEPGAAIWLFMQARANKSTHIPHWRSRHTRSPGRRW